MDITIGITVSDDANLASAEERLVHSIVADNGFVMSALILRKHDNGVSVPWYEPDENTRQSR